MKATITNDFHGTYCTLNVPADGMLSPSQIKRCRRALCGIEGCTCGGNLSERGKQGWEIEPVSNDTIRIVTDK